MFPIELLLNGWTDFDETFYVCLSGPLDGLDLQLDPVFVNFGIFLFFFYVFVGRKEIIFV